jgi:hypothetical protein
MRASIGWLNAGLEHRRLLLDVDAELAGLLGLPGARVDLVLSHPARRHGANLVFTPSLAIR